MSTSFDDWEGQYLCHHGVKGQKWGVRRYQNPDGSLTEAGKRHQQKGFYKTVKKEVRLARKNDKEDSRATIYEIHGPKSPKRYAKAKRHDYSERDITERVLAKLPKDRIDMKKLKSLGNKWDSVGKRANDYENYAYHKTNHMGKALTKSEKTKLTKLLKEDHDAQVAYTTAVSDTVSSLLGKYSKRKITEERIFGIPMKTKAERITERALYRLIPREMDEDKKKTKRKK